MEAEGEAKAAPIVKETVQESFNNYQVDCVNFSVLTADEIATYSEVGLKSSSPTAYLRSKKATTTDTFDTAQGG